MKKFYLLLTAVVTTTASLTAQDIIMDPWPIVPGEPVTMYVDITSATCNCPELQDADPDTNPLYVWTYQPNEARPPIDGNDVTNGDWFDSNENLRMYRDANNPNLWYFDFLGYPLTTFYGVDQTTAETNGLAFLIKENNGSPEGLPEQKSVDMGIALEFGTVSTTDLHRDVVSFEVFPNPAANNVRVQLTLSGNAHRQTIFTLFSTDGRAVLQTGAYQDLSQGVELDLSGIAPGMYLVRATDGGTILATKKLQVN